MCKGTLWVDSSTLKIVDHREAGHQKPDLEQFLKDSKKDKGWDEKMKKAREDEARRKAEIEAKFKQVTENSDNNSNDNNASSAGPRSLLDWD